MRTLTRSILAAGTVVGLLALPVAGASADNHTTTVTFEVANTGGLSVATASANHELSGTAFDTSSTAEATGALPQMTVTDNTNPLLGSWSVTVDATSFSNGTTTIAGEDVSYWSNVPTIASGVVVPVAAATVATPVTLDATQTAVTATGAVGNNSVTFTPSITVDLTGATVGTYSGDIVHSVTAS